MREDLNIYRSVRAKESISLDRLDSCLDCPNVRICDCVIANEKRFIEVADVT